MNFDASIGIDLGGTKISGIVLGQNSIVLAKKRVSAPRGSYNKTIAALKDLLTELESSAGLKSDERTKIGLGIPGAISPKDGRVQNANSTWLNGRQLDIDLAAATSRDVRACNDANCFALSEAFDGAGQDASAVFGVIIGTGCGGGLVRHGEIVDGPRGIGGEWGHNPLPWPRPDEIPGPVCWCGRNGCMETWVSGTGLEADYERSTGGTMDAATIAGTNSEAAKGALQRHSDRLARGLATVVNLVDPDVIVLGGGLSKMNHLYSELPDLIAPHIFATDTRIDIRRPVHGDDSGVRGAARLWHQNTNSPDRQN